MKPLAIALVGLRFGHDIAHWLRKPDASPYFRIEAVCDLDREKVERTASRFECRALPDLDAVLADPAVDVVGLFTPPQGRARLLRRCIQAGKDVITTKPFELDPEAAREVLLEAENLGRTIHLNSPAPFLPTDLRTIRDWQSEFDLGRPVSGRAETWVRYREQADGGWYDQPEKCPVPPILRIGIYPLNDLILLMGKLREVHVTSSRLFTGRPTADNAQMQLVFENGALGNLFASFCVEDGQLYKNSLTLNYERGTIYRNPGRLGSMTEADLTLVTLDAQGQPLWRESATTDISGEYQWEAAYRAITGQAQAPEVGVEEIVEGVRALRAMALSEQSGRPVSLDQLEESPLLSTTPDR